jgi:hypothetical protein
MTMKTPAEQNLPCYTKSFGQQGPEGRASLATTSATKMDRLTLSVYGSARHRC